MALHFDFNPFTGKLDLSANTTYLSTIYVPYTGATGNVDLGSYGVQATNFSVGTPLVEGTGLKTLFSNGTGSIYGNSNTITVTGSSAAAYGIFSSVNSAGASTNQSLFGIECLMSPHAAGVQTMGIYLEAEDDTINDPTANQIGYYISWNTDGTDANMKRWAFYNDSNNAGGKVFLGKDNQKTYFGTGYDASLYFDGSDLIINSENVTASDEVHFNNWTAVDFSSANLLSTGTLTGISSIDSTGTDWYFRNPVGSDDPTELNLHLSSSQYDPDNYAFIITGSQPFEIKAQTAAGEWARLDLGYDVITFNLFDNVNPQTTPLSLYPSSVYINLNSTTALHVETDGTKDDVFVVDTTNARIGLNCQPTFPLHMVLSATDAYGLYIDGTTNPFTTTGAASVSMLITRVYQRALTGSMLDYPILFTARIEDTITSSGSKASINTYMVFNETLTRDMTISGTKNVTLTTRINYFANSETTDGVTITNGAYVSDNYYMIYGGLNPKAILNNALLNYIGNFNGIYIELQPYVTNTASNSRTITGKGIHIEISGQSAGTGTGYGGYFYCVNWPTANYGIYANGATGAVLAYGHYLVGNDNAYDLGDSTKWVRSAYLKTRLYFRDTALGIYSQDDSFLDLYADGAVRIGDSSSGAPTNYARFAPDGELILAGTARVTKEIVLGSADLRMGASDPGLVVEKLNAVLTGNYVGYYYGITDNSIFTFTIPADWDPATDISIYIYWYINEAYATNSGEVQWRIKWSACPANETEAVDGATHTGTIDYGDQNIPATSKFLTRTSAGTISAASLAAGDLVGINMDRVVLDGGNNPAVDPVVVKVGVEYISNKLGAAT